MKRLRDEAGMTIMEVVMAATVGLIVLSAMFAMLDATVRLNTGVIGRTDAMQRGRLAMDQLTQELRSQVCLENLAGPAVVPGATANQVEFYSDFSDGSGEEWATKRRVWFEPKAGDPTAGDIKVAVYESPVPAPDPGDFSPTPTQTSVRRENAALELDAGDQPVPFLRYYAYRWVGDPPRPEADLELIPPIDGNEARRVARIDVTFVARPTGAKDRAKSVNLTDRVMVRHSDPNLAKWDPVNPTLPDPRCI